MADTYKAYLMEHRRRQNKGAYGKDSEMGKVYKAEWSVKGLRENKLKDIHEVEKFVQRVCKSKTWAQLSKRKHVLVTEMKDVGGGIAACAEYGGLIKIKKSHMNKYVVLHELAHCAGHYHHGRSFRQVLVKLTSRFLGRELANELKAAFKKQKLSYGEPRKPLTEAQWNQRRKRLVG